MNNVFGVLILAGGKSQRMNSPKPFLQINGRTFLENIVDSYSKSGYKKISLVINHSLLSDIPDEIRADKSVRIIPNYHPENGRLYSIQLGLSNAPDFTFIHNIDNPFVDKNTIRLMQENIHPDEYIVPVYNGTGGHPVLIPKKIAKSISSVKNLTLTLRDVLCTFKKREVISGSKNILVNINDWKDYEENVLNKVPAKSCEEYI